MKPIAELIGALDSGAVTGLALADDCLERIADPAGEGGRAFLAVDPDRVRAEARTIDDARRAGRAPSVLAGIPVSIKALFDVEGMVTTAGSTALRDALPARGDAEAVRRLRSAGRRCRIRPSQSADAPESDHRQLLRPLRCFGPDVHRQRSSGRFDIDGRGHGGPPASGGGRQGGSARGGPE